MRKRQNSYEQQFAEAPDNPYAGKLAAFGDPVLDELASRTRTRSIKEKVILPQECPSCHKVALLHKEVAATLCQECHDDITERARRPYR